MGAGFPGKPQGSPRQSLNGVRGRVEGLVLDERERLIQTKETHTIRLQYPPRYVLVKLDRTKAPTLEGLSPNVIPIAPVKKTFTVNKNGSKVSVTRSQLPLTLAYAFTDYRSQGQTLQPVIVDIAPPPYGHLTPFNIYVALSRGTGRESRQYPSLTGFRSYTVTTTPF
jgi:hypothetical protein